MHRFRRPFWTLQAFGWTAYGVSTYLSILPDLAAGQYLVVLVMKVVRTGFGFALSLPLYRLCRSVLRRGGSYRRAALLAAPASAALGVVWLAAYRVATQPVRPADLSLGGWATAPRASLDYAFVLLAWTAAYLGISAWRAARAEERRAVEAMQRAQVAELRMLRYQLNPHFLFNALNSLRASIPLDAAVARDLVDALSDFLRHTLQASPGALEPVDDEIRSVENYLAIEKLRFGDRLETDVRVESEARTRRVPNFVLQPLVENAVKHGMASGARPLHVSVRAAVDGEGLWIEVVNDLGPKHADDGEGLGIGLDNVRERLALAFPDEACLELRREPGRACAVLRIDAAREPAHA